MPPDWMLKTRSPLKSTGTPARPRPGPEQLPDLPGMCPKYPALVDLVCSGHPERPSFCIPRNGSMEIKFIYLVASFFCALAGGYVPLSTRRALPEKQVFPAGESFASGVFLALALLMLLPASIDQFSQLLPASGFPLASLIAVAMFLVLLALEHRMARLVITRQTTESGPVGETQTPALVPLLLTSMIALPSFCLGVALGVSDTAAASMIFIAIILHKGTAAFALALSMVRSTLSTPQAWMLFILFASMTPAGVAVGTLSREMHVPWLLPFQALVMAAGAGTFLYMAILQGLRHAPMIQYCNRREGFLALIAGFAVTAVVRLIVGEAHHF